MYYSELFRVCTFYTMCIFVECAFFRMYTFYGMRTFYGMCTLYSLYTISYDALFEDYLPLTLCTCLVTTHLFSGFVFGPLGVTYINHITIVLISGGNS